MTREPDPIWDAAVAECYPSGVATGMRKEVNGLVRDLKDLNATSAEIHRRARLYRGYCKKKDLMFGLRGLVRRWDQFSRPPPKGMTRDQLDAEQRRRDEAAVKARREVAEKIVARHTDEECEAAWQKYLGTLGYRARFLKDRTMWPEVVARYLEPDGMGGEPVPGWLVR